MSAISQLPLPPTQDPWQGIVVHKKKADGQFIQRGNQRYPFKYTLDTRTNELYWYEDPTTIRVKSAALLIGAPFHTLCYVFYNAIKLPVDLLTICCNPSSMKKVAYDVWNLVRSPFLLIGVLFAALYGLLSPYEGRKLEAKIESIWNYNLPYFADWKYASIEQGKRLGDCLCVCHPGDSHVRAAFIAWCFQTRGKVTDDRFQFVGYLSANGRDIVTTQSTSEV